MKIGEQISSIAGNLKTSITEYNKKKRIKQRYVSLRNRIRAVPKMKYPVNRLVDHGNMAEMLGISEYEVNHILTGIGKSKNPMVMELFKEISVLMYMEQPDRLDAINEMHSNVKKMYERELIAHQTHVETMKKEFPNGIEDVEDLKFDISGWKSMCDTFEHETFERDISTCEIDIQILACIVVAKSRYFTFHPKTMEFGDFDYEQMRQFNYPHISDILTAFITVKEALETEDAAQVVRKSNVCDNHVFTNLRRYNLI